MSIVSGPTRVVLPSLASKAEGWTVELRRAIRDPDELCARLQLPPDFAARARGACQLFPLFVPLPYLARIQPSDPSDPLLRQVLPLPEETEVVSGFSGDPLLEADYQSAPGLLHKYAGRALLVTTGACAIHCRYCFRRHFPYSAGPKSTAAWQASLDVLRQDPALHEIILSGGDPLTLPDDRLRWLVEQLEAIDHLRRLRVHTRLPVMIPARVNESWLSLCANSRFTVVMVLHINHAAEMDAEVLAACARLRQAGVLLLNQSVLLRGVNDNLESLRQLSLSLVDGGIVPYYLHHMDSVAGAHHFVVPTAQGKRLVEALREVLPGYAVPQYVREVPGATNKLPIH